MAIIRVFDMCIWSQKYLDPPYCSLTGSDVTVSLFIRAQTGDLCLIIS